MRRLHVDVRGSGPRVVLVHGSVGNGRATWGAQRPLADRFTLVVPERSGYPPNPPLERIDFERQADELAALLEPGDHLVGHSYGGVVSLLAAARRSDVVRSLTVNEPPAFGLARGDASVEEFIARVDALRARDPSPREYLETFLPLVGVEMRAPARLSPTLTAGARAAIAERLPQEAEIPLDTLAAAAFPKLVVTGAHSAALDTVADVLEAKLPAERALLPGAGHNLPRAPGYNDVLAAFLDRAA